MSFAYTARILLVEDDRVDQIAVERELLRLGVAPGTLATADDGVIALEYLEQALQVGILPALIILDLRMPRMDGIDFLRVVRNHREAAVRNMPVVVVSSSNMDRDRQATADLGVNAYFNKRDEYHEFLIVLGAWAAGDRSSVMRGSLVSQ